MKSPQKYFKKWITFVGANPFSTSFASRHSWRVRQSEEENCEDGDEMMIVIIMMILTIMMLEGIRESEDENHDIPLDSVGWLLVMNLRKNIVGHQAEHSNQI